MCYWWTCVFNGMWCNGNILGLGPRDFAGSSPAIPTSAICCTSEESLVTIDPVAEAFCFYGIICTPSLTVTGTYTGVPVVPGPRARIKWDDVLVLPLD